MQRRAIVVHGIVQGVGFRPFVHELATRLGLAGFVQNRGGSVRIEVEGEPGSLDRFIAELAQRPPPLAQIDSLAWEPVPGCDASGFRIEHSDLAAADAILISPDSATCADCLRELFEPADRRYRYPFINCTNCGPRLTIVTGAPYDRVRTTMAGFAMCAACRTEYDDPADRRFHAQPIACPACGPRLRLLNAERALQLVSDPLAAFAQAIWAGQIGALKGLGGFHLVCDARRPGVVAELRRRKHRDEKPFALMVADLAAAEQLCLVDEIERGLLVSRRRPIVLLRRRPEAAVAAEVAPNNPFLGLMLPYTPLHHLLLRSTQMPLVMTSGNRSDEPIVFRDEDLDHLDGIADLFMTYERAIHVRCDDSVTRVVAGREAPLRRSRGYAPLPLSLPFACAEPLLAVGGQLKGTFALGRGRQAILSHHLGDLDHYAAFRAFVQDAALYAELFDIQPLHLVHDLHPDYATTRWALEQQARAATSQGSPVKLQAVQHHHAHLASCLAEHGLTGPAIGVIFDGTGYGTDGAIWGGEFLVGGYADFERAAHLRYVGMPGGEQAIREPWRMALAHLLDAGEEDDLLPVRISPGDRRIVGRMLEQRLRSPPTSSVGRLFDAVAALIGLRQRVSYEGQAAIELEWRASGVAPAGDHYSFEVNDAGASTGGLEVDTRPLIAGIARDIRGQVADAVIARRFHETMAALIAVVCGRLRDSTGISTVALSGGVFMNALLSSTAAARLEADDFEVYQHTRVPPNDGGLSLGQLAVAAARSAVTD